MSKTVVVNLSDAEIKRQMMGAAHTLRDARYPGVRFRFLTDRTRGSWFLIQGGKWQRLGAYPLLSAKQVLGTLPELLARKAANPDQRLEQGEWLHCEGLLSWYRDRVLRNRSLSLKRKASVETIIDKHLLPCLSGVAIDSIDREVIDRQLVWPLQESYSVSYVRQIMRVAQQAFAQALKLNMIPENPLAGFKFAEFVQAREKPKAGRLRPTDLPELIQRLQQCYSERVEQGMLALIMLMHGTRIGETRLARWRDISLGDRVWFIPAENTKTRAEHVLPLTEQACQLLVAYRERMAGRDADYLFVDGMGQLLNERQASSAFKWMSGGDWSSHDLRKLARTCWAELGVDYLIGERLLNHQMGVLAQTYVLTTQEELKRKALEQWHNRLDECGLSAFLSETDIR